MDDKLTLYQGLERFHIKYREHLSHHEESLSADAISFFRCHDIAHVLFACDISLFGEGAVKIWTIFGTTLGFWNHIKEYRKVNAYQLSKNFGFTHTLKNLFKFLFCIPTIIIRANQMNRSWPWNDFEAYLDKPISAIRKEFNIKVINY